MCELLTSTDLLFRWGNVSPNGMNALEMMPHTTLQWMENLDKDAGYISVLEGGRNGGRKEVGNGDGEERREGREEGRDGERVRERQGGETLALLPRRLLHPLPDACQMVRSRSLDESLGSGSNYAGGERTRDVVMQTREIEVHG